MISIVKVFSQKMLELLNLVITNLLRFLFFLMCYSVDMMRWAGRASLVTMNQEVYEASRKSGGFFETKKVLKEDLEHEYSNPQFVQAITNKIWKVLQLLLQYEEVLLKMFFLSLLLRQRWHTARRCVVDMRVTNVYRGGWMLCKVTKAIKDDKDKFKNVEVVVKSKQNNEHEFQLNPLPLHEPDDQGDVAQFESLHELNGKEGSLFSDDKVSVMTTLVWTTFISCPSMILVARVVAMSSLIWQIIKFVRSIKRKSFGLKTIDLKLFLFADVL